MSTICSAFLSLLLSLVLLHRQAAAASRPISSESSTLSPTPAGMTAVRMANWLERGAPGTVALSGAISTVRLPELGVTSPAAAQGRPALIAEEARDAVAAAEQPGATQLELWLNSVRELQPPPGLEEHALPESSIPNSDDPRVAPSADRQWLWQQAREAAKGFDPAKFATPEGRDEAAQEILLRIMDNAPLGLANVPLGAPEAPETGARAFGYKDGAWVLLREGPAVLKDAQAWSGAGIVYLRLTGLPLVGPEGRFRYLGDPVPGSYKEFAGGTVDLTLAWSSESGKYVILEARARLASRAQTFVYQTVSGRAAGGGFALLESFRMSLHGGGRLWAEKFPELRVERVPLGIEGKLSILGQDGLASFGASYEGKLAAVFLSWSEPEKRYVVTRVRVETEGGPRSFGFKTIWGRRGPGRPLELLGSYHHYSRISRVRAWGRVFPELELRSATLYDNGRLGVLGETDVLVLGREYEGRSADVSLAWSEPTKRYVVTEVRVSGGPTLSLRTVWGMRPASAEPALLDSYWRRYPGKRFPWKLAEFPRLAIKAVELDRSGRFSTLTYNNAAKFPTGYAGGSAEVFLTRLPGGKGYVITHARGEARGKEPMTLWFTLLSPPSKRTWPPALVRQSAYQGGRQWWWLGRRSGVKAGDVVWIPWSAIAPGVFHSRTNAALYRFDHDPSQSPTYGVYRWTGEGRAELLGAWAGERWIQARRLARHRARLNAEQQRMLEELFERADEVWGHDADLLDAAVEAAATAVIKGLSSEQARARMKQAVQRERFSRRTALLDDIGYRPNEAQRPFEPEDASRAARPVQNAAQKALGAKLVVLLTAQELSALVEAYGLDPEDYGWDPARLPRLSEGPGRESLDSGLAKIRQAADSGRLNELDALFP